MARTHDSTEHDFIHVSGFRIGWRAALGLKNRYFALYCNEQLPRCSALVPAVSKGAALSLATYVPLPFSWKKNLIGFGEKTTAHEPFPH
jgi:hypothetical protein